ncbi:MAG: menD [Marmoricola sp.]|nr:menD [Marmoricola sp.]
MTNAATTLARHVLDALIAEGAEHVVLCPGSRSAPLAYAAYAEAQTGRVTLHSRIDERTAGFLALGIAKATGKPAAVITTSGTAAANLHPAVLEASHAGVRLVVITADRPAALRETLANQTTNQVRLFGDAATFVDVPLASGDPLATAQLWSELVAVAPLGPTHLNVQFADPLVPGVEDGTDISVPPATHDRLEPEAVARQLLLGPRTVVVAGDDAGARARTLAEHANWPLFAEPTSGSRNGSTPIRTYRLLLGSPLAAGIQRVVVVGHPTLSRPVSNLLSRAGVEVVSVRAGGRWPDRAHPVSAEHERVAVTDADNPAWLEKWRAADKELSDRLDELVDSQPELTPYDVAAAVNQAVPPNGLLYVGASNPIRDLDLMARPYPVGQRRKIIANRGLAGIDGTLSSAIGAAIARPDTSRAIAYVGDVTFLHDMTALVIGPDEVRPDLTIVVVNDNGGSIFATLEQGAPAFEDSFDKLFGTPHDVDLGSLCAATRTPHWKVHSKQELEHALANPNGGIEVIEAVVRRDNRRELDAAIRELGIQQLRSSGSH